MTYRIYFLYMNCVLRSRVVRIPKAGTYRRSNRAIRGVRMISSLEPACTRPLATVYTVGTSCRHCELTLSYATLREKLRDRLIVVYTRIHSRYRQTSSEEVDIIKYLLLEMRASKFVYANVLSST